MLKAFAEYLQTMKENKTYEIGGRTYSDKPLVEIAPPVDRPEMLTVNGLDSCVALIRREIKRIRSLPVYVRVESPRVVEVFSEWDDRFERDNLYRVACDVPQFNPGWMDYETAIIKLRSGFVETGDLGYLLDLLGSIRKDDGVQTEDNGVSQIVTATQGVSLKRNVQVKPRVALAPYRTFTEVEQPASEFLLRLSDDGQVGLFEADGGFWRLAAKRNIADYFARLLQAEIDAGNVVVMV